MSLLAGERLGPYEILGLIGSGGMGEVYRARDTRLAREVAIKVSDAQFTERFSREAQLIASLNHPNICTLFDVGPNYLVMELVEGPTLADRQGPMPLDDAIPLALQIAQAVEAAHEKGIIHRDLKPANIKLTAEGKVKVLDFGLAKAMDRETLSGIDPATSPTLIAATQTGVILGTAAYMAPEQARGHVVDRRADIWSFGVVLWEMLTGRRMFDGETFSDTLAAVLRKDIDFDAAPTSMRPLLSRCLERDRKLRLQAIGEARIALTNPQKIVATRKASRLPWVITAAVAVVTAVVLATALWRSARPVERPLISFRVDLEVEPAPDTAGANAILSPDGRRLVFRDSRGRLWSRRLDHIKAVLLPGTEGANIPFFSPDGRWVGFGQAGKMKKISVEGGSPISLCDVGQFRGASWGDDGNIIAALNTTTPLVRVSSSGGTPTPVTQLDEERKERSHRWPSLLPGGKAVLFTVITNQYDDATIEMQRLDGGGRKILHHGGSFARYIPDNSDSSGSANGYLLYVNRGTVFALPFNLARLEVTARPTPILEGVEGATGAAQFDFSRDGKLVYRSGDFANERTIQWLDASGKTAPLLVKPGGYLVPRLSPDGQRLAMSKESNIWIYDWQRDVMTHLTFGSNDFHPEWSPDGRYIVFGTDLGIFYIRADGSGKAQRLIEGKNLQPLSFRSDGKRLAFSVGGATWTSPIDELSDGLRAGKPEQFLTTPFLGGNAAFSPNGKWMAYGSNESGITEVYVRAFPDTGGKWQISNGGGTMPRWSRNGTELFFRTMSEPRIMVSTYKTQGNAFVPNKPRVWSEKRFAGTGPVHNFDIAPDGKRFVVLMGPEQSGDLKPDTHVMILLNFFDEVKRRVAAGEAR
jgi:serine/threonine protein kinase